MDVSDVRKQKQKLEMDLAAIIDRKLTAFYDLTGVAVKDLYVSLIHVKASGQKTDADFVCSEVCCDVRL